MSAQQPASISHASIISAAQVVFDAEVQVVIIGGGAAGLVSALRVREAGAEALVIERDATPRGSTSLSAGLIPAPATRFQRAAGISDSVELFARDILRKAKEEPSQDAPQQPSTKWLHAILAQARDGSKKSTGTGASNAA